MERVTGHRHDGRRDLAPAHAAALQRDPERAAGAEYDVIVIGGGIYGVGVLLETARRGLQGLLLERDDFGGATSSNSLRILHGGLRYLQHLDLRRFRESVAERRWFLRTFPDLVEPLPCLMPLYDRGLKRRWVLRAAIELNHRLSRHRNDGVPAHCALPAGGVIDAWHALELFPDAEPLELCGGALWYDAVMRSPQRIVMEMLRWAAAQGATACNHTEALSLREVRGRTVGVRAADRISGRTIEFTGRVVVNCAGPWARRVAQRFGGDREELWRPSLAFNVLLDRPAPSRAAIAIAPPERGSPVYFIVPHHGLLMLGTAHAPCPRASETAEVTEERVAALIAQVSHAAPALGLDGAALLRVSAGLLPAKRSGSARLARRPVIHNHARSGGPQGLWSISGVKFTTARAVAERALQTIWRARGKRLPPLHQADRPPAPALDLLNAQWLFHSDERAAAASLRRLMSEEAATCIDDLFLRRTAWAGDPRQEQRIRTRIAQLLAIDGPGCDETRAAPRCASVREAVS